MMNNAAGLSNFKYVSANLEANTNTLDNAYVQGKLRRAIHPSNTGTYGFPLGLEPGTSTTDSKSIQYTKLDFTTNTYNVLTGYFEQRSSNTDATPSTVGTIAANFLYFGSTNHGEWIFTPQTAASNAYTLTIYPQDFGSVSVSPKFFITKDNDVPVPGTQSCGSSPVGLSVTGLTGFSEFGFAGGTTFLPVTLKAFTYTTNQCEASLKWITAIEENVRHFEIQQSINGIGWSTTATVAAAGNSGSDKNYRQKVNLQSGVNNFFRLRTVDFDGKVTLSPVNKQVVMASKQSLFILNPVKDLLIIQGLPEGTKQLVVYNAIGKTVAKHTTGNSFTTITFAHFPKGFYYMKALSAEGVVLKTEKIIK